jgi:hypothetical protein
MIFFVTASLLSFKVFSIVSIDTLSAAFFWIHRTMEDASSRRQDEAVPGSVLLKTLLRAAAPPCRKAAVPRFDIRAPP